MIRFRTPSTTSADPPSAAPPCARRGTRDNIANGEVPFRKAYLRAVADRIEVDDHIIRIISDTATLEQVSSCGRYSQFVWKWRARRDSNS